MTKRKGLYNKKYKWVSRLRELDKKILRLLAVEKSGSIEIPVLEYRELGKQFLNLGLSGEAMLKEAVKYGLGEDFISKLRDMVSYVENCSHKLKAVAEAKWDGPMPRFPLFETTISPASELIEQSEGVRAMQEMLEGKDGTTP